MFPNVLLKVYVRELHNRLVSDPDYGGFKEARDVENSIIISDSTLSSILTTKIKNVSKIQGHVWF